MSSKGHNQFSNHHPNQGQRLRAESDVEKEKGEVAKQSSHKHYHDPFGAPHFPPSENLPPQAKRLAMAKKQRAEEQQAQRDAQPHEPSAEQYPDALPRVRGAKAAVGEAWQRVTHDAEPVIAEAKEHAGGIQSAAIKLWDEAMELLRTPSVLMRVIFQSRKA